MKMNATLLAAHIASIIPALAQDSIVNNETIIKSFLDDFEREIKQKLENKKTND